MPPLREFPEILAVVAPRFAVVTTNLQRPRLGRARRRAAGGVAGGRSQPRPDGVTVRGSPRAPTNAERRRCPSASDAVLTLRRIALCALSPPRTPLRPRASTPPRCPGPSDRPLTVEHWSSTSFSTSPPDSWSVTIATLCCVSETSKPVNCSYSADFRSVTLLETSTCGSPGIDTNERWHGSPPAGAPQPPTHGPAHPTCTAPTRRGTHPRNLPDTAGCTRQRVSRYCCQSYLSDC